MRVLGLIILRKAEIEKQHTQPRFNEHFKRIRKTNAHHKKEAEISLKVRVRNTKTGKVRTNIDIGMAVQVLEAWKEWC